MVAVEVVDSSSIIVFFLFCYFECQSVCECELGGNASPMYNWRVLEDRVNCVVVVGVVNLFNVFWVGCSVQAETPESNNSKREKKKENSCNKQLQWKQNILASKSKKSHRKNLKKK